MPEKFSSEKSYEEHKDAARQLERVQLKKEELDNSNPINRLIAVISGKRKEIEAGVKQSERTYEENLKLAQEHIDEMHEEANEYVRTYEVYKNEQQRLMQELGSQYAERVEAIPWPASPSDISAYIDELMKLEVQDDVALEDRARIAAAMDVFKPRINNPGWAGMTFVIGPKPKNVIGGEVGIYNGTRFPRWELGQEDMAAASEIAKNKGWKKVLEISTAITTPGIYLNPPAKENTRVKEEKNVYIAVSDETARLLEQAGPENLDSVSYLGAEMGSRTGESAGNLRENFRVVDLEQDERAK